MASESSDGVLAVIADSLGASEMVLRLMVSLLIGYPLAFFHRHYLHKKSPNIHHIFFTITGLALAYYNFGFNCIHSFINILIIYALLLITGGTSLSVALAFIINTTYLCIGYYATMTNVYTVRWTTSHCVLTLRLIGLVYDVMDGKQKPEQLSEDQKTTALRGRLPSLLEMFGHMYFFGGFLVGPQFPMKRYMDFVNGAFSDTQTGGRPTSVTPALQRLCAGLCYATVYQVCSLYLDDTFLESPEFYTLSLAKKCLYITLWGKLMLNKYVACWLIAEGSCILTGLTYNGKDENGNDVWNGCANINIYQFESASTCQETIAGFNINTNKWMARYIYKRLKFLGNRDISTAVTMFYLALWHGLYSGYFMNFFLELVIIKFEKESAPIIMSLPVVGDLIKSSVFKPVVWFVKKLYQQFVLSYALVGFALFTYERYIPVYGAVFFVGHIPFLVWPFISAPLKKMTRKLSQQQQRPSEVREDVSRTVENNVDISENNSHQHTD